MSLPELRDARTAPSREGILPVGTVRHWVPFEDDGWYAALVEADGDGKPGHTSADHDDSLDHVHPLFPLCPHGRLDAGDGMGSSAELSILGDPVRVDGESRKARLHRKGGEGRWESWW